MNVVGHAVGGGIPTSFDGNGFLFAGDLFALLMITSLSSVIATVFGRLLWASRHEARGPAWAFCSLVFAACIAAIIRYPPEIVYSISYGEVSQHTRDVIQNIKRVCNVVSMFPAIFWLSTVYVWRNEIILRLKAPTARIWVDYRFSQGKGLLFSVTGLSFVLSTAIALGRYFM